MSYRDKTLKFNSSTFFQNMTDTNNGKRRVTCKRPHPNQRIHELLITIHQEAVNIKSAILPAALEEAIESLAKYPLPITSVADCAILKGFGKKLCDYIQSQLNEQSSQNKKNKVSENEMSIDIQSGSGHDNKSLNVNDSDSKSKSSDVATSLNTNRKRNRNRRSRPRPKMTSETYSNNIENGSEDKAPHRDCKSPINMAPYESFKDPSALLGKWDWDSSDHSSKLKASLAKDCYGELEYTFKPLNPVPNDTQNDRNDDQESNSIMEIVDSPSSPSDEIWQKNLDKDNEADASQLQWGSGSNDCFQALPSKPVNASNETGKESSCALNPGHGMLEQTDKQNKNIIQAGKKVHTCDHTPNVKPCSLCTSITTIANEFETSFKEKVRKETMEIDKCVLPRRVYLPGYRTPPYALLVALLEQRTECPYRISLTKSELIQKAQKHSDQSFTIPEKGTSHTAWKHSHKLIIKGFIETITNGSTGEDYYTLTTMGRATAMQLVKEGTYVTKNDARSLPNDRVPSLKAMILSPPPAHVPLDEGDSPEPVFIEMPPGTFDIILLIDKREQFNPSRSHKCKNELRSLTVGDFVWVARSKKTGQELVLPYIVERKRLDDLASSIKDGRFHEQKFRLKKSGVKNIIYVIESLGKNKNVGLPIFTLKQALVNTRIQDGFMVIYTTSLNDTFKFLGKMSDRIGHDFLAKHLRGSNRDTNGKELMTFEFFKNFTCKNKPLTVKETFIKMLLQLKGLSVEKALAITNKYSTPIALMKAYDSCTEKEGELLLASLKYDKLSRNVGPAISKTIYMLFSKMHT